MIANTKYSAQIYYKNNTKNKLEYLAFKSKIIFDDQKPKYTAKSNIINKDITIEQKLLFNNNNKQIEKKYGNKFNKNSLNNFKSYHFININYLYHNLYITSLIILIIIFLYFPMILTKEIKLRELNKESEIIISMRGSGNKYVLNQYYNNLPSQVFINNDEQTPINEENLYNLPDGEISVKLKWSYPLSNCVNMFKDLSDILSINFVKFDTSLVTEMNGMFMGCTSLVSLDLSNIDSKNVNNMIDMFNRCTSLKSINLDNFSTSSATMMNAMFYSCSSLESINLDNFDTSKVISMESIFMECTSLTSLDLKHFNTKSLVRMGDMFNNCNSLTILDLSNFNTKSANYMNAMFSRCSSLTSLKIKSFDTSNVINMAGMFRECLVIKSLDLSNFDTSKVTDMIDMFNRCESLVSLNLISFKTSLVENFNAMFYGCSSLEYLDLSSFKTPLSKSMNSMFTNCAKLKFLDLSSFDTSKVSDMYGMFKSCSSLISLNLNNFDTSEAINTYSMFEGCSSLISLNLNQFNNTDKVTSHFNMFVNVNPKLTYCLNRTGMSGYIRSYLNSYENDCNNTCFTNVENRFIIEKNECIDQCYNDGTYRYEYKLICYITCPKGTHISSFNEFLCEDDLICEKYYNYTQTGCLEQIPDGFYLNNSVKKTIDKCDIQCEKCSKESVNKKLCISCNINGNYYPKLNDNSNVDDFIKCYNTKQEGYYLDKSQNIYMPCYSDCKNCEELGNENNNKCTECNSNYILVNQNCFEKCSYYHYFDFSNKYHCTLSNECPNEFNKLIKDKNQCIDECIKDSEYNLEYNNVCYNDCPDGTIVSSNNKNLCEKDCPPEYLFINKITDECLLNCSALDFFNNICGIRNNNNYAKDMMIKTIEKDIEKGELDILLEKDDEDKIKYEGDTLYQLTNSNNQNYKKYSNISNILLGDCENKLKDIYGIDKNKSLIIFKVDYFKSYSLIPIIGYEVFHPEKKFKLNLTDCNESQINLNIPVNIDEKNLFKYDPNNEFYTDECNPYTTENGTDILIDDRQIEYNYYNLSICENNCVFKEYVENTKKSICECKIKNSQITIVEIVDNKDILSYNFINNESSSIIPMKCYSTLFTKDGIYKNIGSYILIFTILGFTISIIPFYMIGFPKIENKIKSVLLSKVEKHGIHNYHPKENANQDFKSISKYRYNNTNRIGISIPEENSSNTNHISVSKMELGNSKELVYSVKGANINYIQNKIDNLKTYSIYELNELSYKEAFENDKRSYFSYYISLIITKHPLFLFFYTNDINPIIIKIDLFLISFSIYYFINCLFFGKGTIHKIYKDEGKFNSKYLIPYAFFSFLISYVLCSLIMHLLLLKINLRAIKEVSKINNEKSKQNVEKIKRILKVKYILFFSLGFLFLLFFWYYLSSFGSIYQNTQLFVIKNALISFAFSVIYLFVINLIPGILRIYSLKETNRVCVYNTSKIIQKI